MCGFFGDREIQIFGGREIQILANPDFGDLEIQKFGIQQMKKYKFSKLKSVLPKMLARSGLVGKKSSRPYLGPSKAIFSMDRQNPKNARILVVFALFSLVGYQHLLVPLP